MAEIVNMPKLSDTMTEGVVAEWHKKVGDKVESGEILAEIESDKATLEFESFYDGVLLHIGVQKGETAVVDSLLAIIGEDGEDVSAIIEQAKKTATVKQEVIEEPKEIVEESSRANVSNETLVSTPASTAPIETTSESVNGRLKASPLAKKLAHEKGIDISRISGTGDHGRVVKRDVENYTPSLAGASVPLSIGTESFSEKSVSQMRKSIAKSLTASKFTAPHYYLKISVDMDNAIAARKQINALPDTKVSFNDMVIKATAMALRKHPNVNSSWLGDKIRFNEHINIGVAVAVEDGLLVPVVRFADNLPMTTISAQVKDFAQRAKDKKLQPKDWEGSTFAISNLGMFGIEEFTSIINQPNSAILSVGTINEVPVVKDGQIVPGNIMKLSLSCDHRTVDGATGAAFLATLKQYLENPVTMLA